MCNPASFVLTKKSAFWSMSSDHHTKIREEYGIAEETSRVPRLIKSVSVEITPPDGDMRRPIEEWAYRVDQDLLPEWYDAEDCERRARLALADWHEARVILDGEHEITGDRHVYALGNSTVTAWGNSTVTAWGNSVKTTSESPNAVVIDRSKPGPPVVTVGVSK